MRDIQTFAQAEKIHIHAPKRGEKVELLEFAHTNLLNFAFKEEMSGIRNATLSKKTMEDLLQLLDEKSEKLSQNSPLFEASAKKNEGARG